MNEPKQYGLNVVLPKELTPILDTMFNSPQLKGWRKRVMQVALLAVTGKWEKEVRVNP